MDSDAQTSQQPERVEITDYRGTSAAPLTAAAPPRLPSIKQVEGERAIVAADLPPSLTLADGKLIMVKNRRESLNLRVSLILANIIWLINIYDQLSRYVGGNSLDYAYPSEVVTVFANRLSFELVTDTVGVLLFTFTLFYLLLDGLRIARGHADTVIFNHVNDTITNKSWIAYELAKPSQVSAVNLDQQGNNWRVALATTANKLVELNSWKNEQTAARTADAIATYLNLRVARTTSTPRTTTDTLAEGVNGCMVGLVIVVALIVVGGLGYWLFNLVFH